MPTLTTGDIPPNIALGPHQWARVNGAGTAFEAATMEPLAFTQSSVTRSLNTNFQPSVTNNCIVAYSVDISCSMTLLAGQSGTVFLEISADGSTGWVSISQGSNSNSGTLTVGLALTQVGTACLSGTVPAGYYARLRTANNTSTPTFTYRSGQETTL